MPELPDIELYVHGLRSRVVGLPVEVVRIASPFVLRTHDPPIRDAEDRPVVEVRRLGKRIVLGLSDERFLVFHLMIAGRFRWLRRGAKVPGKIGLAAFDFSTGTLALVESSTKKRASLHYVVGESALALHDPGGLDVFSADLDAFRAALTRENHTLKRSLTDPRLFSGIGNAYSDEILHAARLSPIALTTRLAEEEIARLFDAVRQTLKRWTAALREEFGDRFPGPGDVTAFRPDFAVHGRYGEPCPVCGKPVQRIRYAENETNYCAVCQTGGRVLADRSLSRLLREDWPRSIDEV